MAHDGGSVNFIQDGQGHGHFVTSIILCIADLYSLKRYKQPQF